MILYGSITSVEITWMLRSALKQGVRRWLRRWLRRRVRRSHSVDSRVQRDQRGNSWDGYRSHILYTEYWIILNYTDTSLHDGYMSYLTLNTEAASWWHVASLTLSAKDLSNEVVSSSCWLQDGPAGPQEKVPFSKSWDDRLVRWRESLGIARPFGIRFRWETRKKKPTLVNTKRRFG